MSERGTSRPGSWRRALPSVIGAGASLATLIAILSHDAATMAIRRAFAVTTSAFLNVLGNTTIAQGTDILSGTFGISVVTACTGLFVAGLFVAAVVAFPASWRAKLAGVGTGLSALFLVNVVRLASLYYIGTYWRSALEPLHQLVWQSLVIAVAVALWLFWAGRASRRRKETA